MPLAAGQKLGPYEIVAPLGAGGMGEVYRARDTRLGRDVAVKILPPELAADPERRARFEREARAVAALNHPHICVLHDVGRENDTDYLVMELVEGESLAARLARGPLALSDTIRIGAEIAEALERAHRAGILHRDLKPGNVMLAKSGAKLMDFGLARGTGAALSGSSGSQFATMSRPVTAEGHLVGTFQYMAPEQLEGREADARCDIWALGATLYEMATGERAFEGDSTASLIGAIMRAEPRPLAERAPASPAALERVIRSCLAKDPDQRWQSAGDVGRMLRGLDAASSGGGAVVAPGRRRRPGREALAWALVVLLPLAAFALARRGGGAAGDGLPLRTALPLPRGVVYHFSGDFAGPPAISPDGRRVAFVALDDAHGASIWVRDLEQLDAVPVSGTTGGSFPFWSPDGKSLGFWSGTDLRRVDLETGTSVRVCASSGLRGACWGADRFIVFAPDAQGGLWKVPETGGTPVRLTTPDSTFETTHRFPQELPGGRVLYFSGDHRDAGSAHSSMWAVSADGRTKRKLLECRASAVYSDGYLLYLRDSVLFARPFDPKSLRFTGEPIPTRERIQPDYSTWTSNLSASDNGRLAYVLLGPSFGSTIQERSRTGARLRTLCESANHTGLCLSRDGRTIVQASQAVASADLWSIDVATARRTLSIGTQWDEDMPALSPDGSQVAFTSNRSGGKYRIFVARRDGAGAARELAHAPRDLFPVDWSADGKFLVAGEGNFLTAFWDTLWSLRAADGSREVLQVSPQSDNYGDARLSPDGRWLAFTQGRAGASQIFVIAFPPGWPPGRSPAGRWQASAPPSAFPRWARAGRELVFERDDGTIVSVDVEPGLESVRVGPEQELFRAPLRPQTAGLEVSPDGQRIYVNALSGDDVSRLAVVTHWTAGLARK